MPDDSNEGVAYLKALKQTTAGAVAAPALAHEAAGPATTTVDSSDRFQGAEKRRAPRYKCEGSAEMSEPGHDVRTWATFTDVSLHGCYIEAQATYPVGTVLHMKLEAGGVRVEVKGSVRVSYPYLGMGVAFVEISDENQSRLREMLACITRPTVIMGPGIASSLPATSPLNLPPITHPAAAVEAVTEFFQSHQILMRDDFVRIIKKTQ